MKSFQGGDKLTFDGIMLGEPLKGFRTENAMIKLTGKKD